MPGPIDVPQAQGSNELLRDGAIPITSIADAVTLLGLDTPVRESSTVILLPAMAGGR